MSEVIFVIILRWYFWTANVLFYGYIFVLSNVIHRLTFTGFSALMRNFNVYVIITIII